MPPLRVAEPAPSRPAAQPAEDLVAPAPMQRAAPDATRPDPHPEPEQPRRTMSLRNNDDWLDALQALDLKGPPRTLIDHVTFIGYADNVLRLHLPAEKDIFRSDNLVAQVARALGDVLGAAPRLEFVAAGGAAAKETLHERNQRDRDQRQIAAEAAFASDPTVQSLIQQHGARVVPDSIRPLDER